MYMYSKTAKYKMQIRAKFSITYVIIACPPPPAEFGNGVIADGPVLLDTVREYVCMQGFTTPEPILTQCVPGPDGPIWTTPKLFCIGRRS